jgi:tetrahydromethanopterin S-methyltransferase subunit F
MSELVATENRIQAMSQSSIDKVQALENQVRLVEQEMIKTTHVIHGGMYARTVFIPAGMVMTGVLIRVPTMLIMFGDATVYTGDDKCVRYTGYHVLAASANRKQAFITTEDTTLTMIFATQAKSVDEAEREFTDQFDLLMSRHGGENVVTITGE